jgi:glycogen operon protein
MLDGAHARGGTVQDDTIYVAINMHWEDHVFELPHLPPPRRWHLFADTNHPSPGDIYIPGEELYLRNQLQLPVGARSVVILVGKSVM